MMQPIDHNAVGQALTGGTKPSGDLGGTVRHLAGVLWNDMLSEMNKSGFGPDTLGPGGDEFQSLFMWNVAQNDFGRYDAPLVNAALRQYGGAAPPGPQEIEPAAPALPATATSLVASGAAVTVAAEAAPAGDLVQTAKNFARAVWPALQQAAAALGVPATGLLAQAALETRWGTAAPGNNLFGIKASPGQPSTWQPTHEMQSGVMVASAAAFRAYDSVGASVADYVREIRAVFPHVAGQTGLAGFAQALQGGGYATDRFYAAKLLNLAGSPLMAAALAAVQPPQAQSPEGTSP